MKSFIKRVAVVLDRISNFCLWLSGICLVAMVTIIAIVVFGRYVLHSTPSWGQALSISFMGWFIFLGAAVGVHERTHLGFDVLLYILPPRGKAVLHTLADLAVIAFGIGMIYYGVHLTLDTWDAIKPTLGIPDGARYIPLALGGLLSCVFALNNIVTRVAGMSDEHDVDRSGASLSS